MALHTGGGGEVNEAGWQRGVCRIGARKDTIGRLSWDHHDFAHSESAILYVLLSM